MTEYLLLKLCGLKISHDSLPEKYLMKIIIAKAFGFALLRLVIGVPRLVIGVLRLVIGVLS